MCKIQYMKTNKPGIKAGEMLWKLLEKGAAGNKDATGVIIRHGKNITSAKMTGEPDKLMASNPELWDLLSKSHETIGHNRFATAGDKSDNHNNHPHTIGEWMLIHNGVVRIKDAGKVIIEDLLETNKDLKVSPCDSWEVLAVFSSYFYGDNKDIKDHDERVRKSFEDAIQNFSGSFSIFLTNIKDDHCYYIKEDVKTFHFRMFGRDKHLIMLGSTFDYDIPAGFKRKMEIGLFRGEVDEKWDILNFKPTANMLYKLPSTLTTIDKCIQEVGKITWTSKIEYVTPAAPVKTTIVDDRDTDRVSKYSDELSTIPGRAKAISHRDIKKYYPKFYEAVSAGAVEWDRFFFNSIMRFDLDLAGIDKGSFKEIKRAASLEDLDIEFPYAKSNGKFLSFCLVDGPTDNDELEEYMGADGNVGSWLPQHQPKVTLEDVIDDLDDIESASDYQ